MPRQQATFRMPDAPRPGLSADAEAGLMAARRPPAADPALEDMLRRQGFGPNIQEGLRILAREEPDVATAPIQRAGRLARWMMGSNLASTNPLGTIDLNEEVMGSRSPQEIADTVLHELTHSRGIKERGVLPSMWKGFRENWTLPYSQRPHELEAFQAETARRARQGREGIVPSFSEPGKSRLTYDMPLPGRVRPGVR